MARPSDRRVPILYLEVLEPNGRSRVAVDSGPYTIGRSSENRLQLADGQVSRVHAELRQESDGWRIRDCGSRFGTYINDHKVVDDASVRPGDRLSLRVTVLKATPSKSKPDRGVVTSLVEVLNQSGEIVMTLNPVNMIIRRPPR